MMYTERSLNSVLFALFQVFFFLVIGNNGNWKELCQGIHGNTYSCRNYQGWKQRRIRRMFRGIHENVKKFSEGVKENSGIHGNVKEFSGRKRKLIIYEKSAKLLKWMVCMQIIFKNTLEFMFFGNSCIICCIVGIHGSSWIYCGSWNSTYKDTTNENAIVL